MVTVEVGTVLLGVAALITALGALWASLRARHDATRALESTPEAQLHGLRQYVDDLGERYQAAYEWHRREREGMEGSLLVQRDRAEKAETALLAKSSEVAMLRIDLAETRSDLAALTARFESSLAT